MKNNIILVLLIMCFNCLFSQNNDNIFDKLNGKMESLKKAGIKNIIAISNESGKSVILWKEAGKEKALEIIVKSSGSSKKKEIKLSKKEKGFFNDCLANYKYIEEIKNVNCNKQVHAFTTINVKGIIDGKSEFSHSFYSHCGTEEQRRNIKSLLSLYYSLFLE